MAKKTIPSIIVCIVILCSASLSFSQTQFKYAPKETRNNWGIGFTYSESGVGISSSLYAPIGKSTDLFFNLLVSGVSDSREMERYDLMGNSVIPDKVNRVFMVP